jgi:Chromatin remodelling complex Rsc7/Swp82 subunit
MSHLPQPVNGGLGRGPGLSDGSGTINPAALSSSSRFSSQLCTLLSASSTRNARCLSAMHRQTNAQAVSIPGSRPATAGSQQHPRGVKRSRSPELKYEGGSDRQDEGIMRFIFGVIRRQTNSSTDGPAPRKRGRPPKAVKVSESPVPQLTHSAVQTPQSAQHAPQLSPSQASPSKTTPTKAIKALPTVRDHTSMELNDEGDEYIPRELDPEGEKKVAPNGALLGGRQYRCRTFYMPNRGDRLFMLATECAKVLQYRDSYLLFNKNRSLFKIIANQEEKNDLIQQDILPSSYRSRQIAIVTARSMYRQFGSRLVVNGRRVRDDYFESRARKQGFTEEDLAGEKRPGMAKAREAAAAAAATHTDVYTQLPQASDVIYHSDPDGPGPPIGPLHSNTPYSMDTGDFSSIPRPRHEISGVAYHDRTTPTNPADMLTHASSTAEFNSSISQQRRVRANYMDDMWRRPHDPPPSVQPPDADIVGVSSQPRQSPMVTSSGPVMGQQAIQAHLPQQHTMLPPQYSPQNMQHNILSQSPNRPSPQQLPGPQMHRQGPTGVPMGAGYPAYGYPGPQGQAWVSTGQPQPSPLSQTPMSYGGHHVQQQQQQQPSPHMQGHQGLHHPSQMHAAGMGAYGPGSSPYGNVPGRQMYPGAGSPGAQQHYGMQPGVSGSQAGHMQGWPATTQPTGNSQQWSPF